jgi:hypothetical protein
VTTPIDLKNIELKSWTSYFQDGLWDIFIGLLMLGMGIYILLDEIIWHILILSLALLVLIVGRRLVTIPRVGRVKFGPARKFKQKKVMAVGAISLLVGLALSFIPLSVADPPQTVVAAIAWIWIVLIFGLVAYFMDFRRLFAYGLLFAIAMAFVIAFDNLIPTILVLVSGGIALITGLVMFTHFIRNYPLPAAGPNSEGEADDTP